jgi:hypothetical protein
MERHLHIEILVPSSDENADAEVLDLIKRLGTALQKRNRQSLCLVSCHDADEAKEERKADPVTVN